MTKISKLSSVFFTTLIFVSLQAESVLASTLGDQASKIKTEISSFKDLLYYGGIFVGLFFAITGLVGLTKDQRQGEPITRNLVKIVVGVGLMGLSTIIDLSSQSITGSSSELDKL